MRALLDSGATKSLLSEAVYLALPEETRPKLIDSSAIRVTVADGSTAVCRGKVTLPILAGSNVHEAEFLVGKWSDPAIFGLEDLAALNMSIDFGSFQAACGGERVPLSDGCGKWVACPVQVAETCVVPARSHGVVTSLVTEPDLISRGSEVLLLTPCEGVESDILVSIFPALHRVGCSKVPVAVLNPLSEDVIVEPGCTIAYIYNLSADHPYWDETPSYTVRSAAVHQSADPTLQAEAAKLPAHLQELYLNSVENLDEEQREELAKLFVEFQDTFSRDNYDLGCTDRVKFKIDTGNHPPIRQAPRRINPQAAQAADEIIEELLLHKLIEPSNSPWASPIVMVRRKDGRYRMCIDFRKVNEVTQNVQAWPLPRIDDTLDCLVGNEYYCTNDLTAGYWQVPVDEESKWKTAFVHRSGLYHWNRKPFGVTEAPGVFSRMMAELLSDMLYDKLLVYLDDVILFGRTVKETMSRYREFLGKMKLANLKLKPSKCVLFQKEVTFLGHVVSREGVATDPSKIEAVKCWKVPSNRKEVRSFLGLVGYYRNYIENCSTISKPLTELTSPKTPFLWTSECQQAFETLKQKLTEAPILRFPRGDGQFIVDTDASDTGLGIVLSQVQDEQEVVIAYASRTLSPAEQNYCCTRRELLAIVHGLKVFKSYLSGRYFLVRTDHSSLRYLHNFRSPEGQLARWLDWLQSFSFSIQHRPGSKNGHADALSRKGDPCAGKKCMCKEFSELEYEPPVVMESRGVSDVGVQATPGSEALTVRTLRTALKECEDKPPQLTSRGVQTISVNESALGRALAASGSASCPGWLAGQRDCGDITLFYTGQSPLSNFYPCLFRGLDGRWYNCSEQYYQAAKALVFGDRFIMRKIMEATRPDQIKRLGHKVKGFSKKGWKEIKFDRLREACLLKFSQNPALAHHLLYCTNPKLAEASPTDFYWGIGRAMNDPAALDPKRWLGLNRMGQVLEEVRDRLRGDYLCFSRAVSIQPLWSLSDVRQAQLEDGDIAPVLLRREASSARPKWADVSPLSAVSKKILARWEQLRLVDGILRVKHVERNQEWCRLVLPKKFRHEVCVQAHDAGSSGHLGSEKTLLRVRARFWWPGMRDYIERWVRTCVPCQRRKGPQAKPKAPLQKYVVGAVGERVASDIVGPFSETIRHNKYIIVFICYFSKMAVAVPIPDMSAVTVARALLERWVCYFGCPLELHTDRGAQYCSQVFEELCKLLGIARTHTTPLRPQGDGLCERFNRTLVDMLNCVGQDFEYEWDILTPVVTMAYNSSVQESIAETPNKMVYGRELCLPLALLDPECEIAERMKVNSSAEYTMRLQEQIESVHHLVRERLQSAALKQEKSYNNRLHYRVYSPGDLVLYYYPVKGKQPKENWFKWQGPYVIVERISETVYRIQETPRSASKVVNHDALKPANMRDPPDTSWVKRLPKWTTPTSGNSRPMGPGSASLPMPGPSYTR